MIKTTYSICLRIYFLLAHQNIEIKVIFTLPLLLIAAEPTPLFKP